MKKFFIAVICVLAAVALFFFYKSKQLAPTAGNPSAETSAGGGSAASTETREAKSSPVSPSAAGAVASATSGQSSASSPLQPQDLSARAGSSVPAPNVGPKPPQEAVVQNLRRAVRQYGQMFGGDPVGNNQEITAELTGKNPKQINFLTGQDGMTVNQNGELVDQWGTPYFFHQLSATDMEVRSAGPDQRMWTSDDIVTR
jgi:hypothetical protein